MILVDSATRACSGNTETYITAREHYLELLKLIVTPIICLQ